MIPNRRSPETVGVALRECAHGVATTSDSAWHVALNGERRINARAELEGRWLRLTTPLPGPASPPEAWWTLLERNAALPPHVRIIAGNDYSPRLCTDTFLDDDLALGEIVNSACTALTVAVTRYVERPREPIADQGADEKSPRLARVDRLLAESIWPYVALADGSHRLEFEARKERYRIVACAEGEGIRCGVEFRVARDPGEVSRTASGVALLLSTARLRLVRGVVRDGAPGVEVLLAPEARTADLDRATEALVGTCDQLGREVRALARPDLARDYLRTVMPNMSAADAPLHRRHVPQLAPAYGG